MQRRLLAFLVAILSTGLASPALADPVSLLVSDGSGELGYVNLSTGAVSLVGNTGLALTDIAFSPAGILYGIDYSNLYVINSSTAKATLVGPLDAAGTANSLVFSITGTLYTASSNLYTVSTSTGATTEVGPIGYTSGGDLAFVEGSLDLATSSNQLVSVNTSTGAGTLIGNLGVPYVYGLASPDDHTLYAVAQTSVYEVDPATGQASFLLNYAGQGLGAAGGETFYTEAQATPPSSVTPEPPAALLLASGLCLLAGARRKLGLAALS